MKKSLSTELMAEVRLKLTLHVALAVLAVALESDPGWSAPEVLSEEWSSPSSSCNSCLLLKWRSIF